MSHRRRLLTPWPLPAWAKAWLALQLAGVALLLGWVALSAMQAVLVLGL